MPTLQIRELINHFVPFFTSFRNSWCTRVSSDSSGWKVAAITASLPHQHGIVAAFCQDFDALANSFDARRANEHHLQRIAAERAGCFDNGGIDLPSIGIAADGDIECIEAGLMRVLDLLWPA